MSEDTTPTVAESPVETLPPAKPAADTPQPSASLLTEPVAEEKAAGSDPEQTAEQEKAEPAAEEKAESAPEVYEFVTPEGVELDKEALGKFEELARSLNLSQEKAQPFVDLAISMMDKWSEQLIAANEAAREANRKAIQNDPEFGGDKLASNLAVARKAFDLVAHVPGFKEVLDKDGFGDHPAVIKAFWHIGQLVSEDRFVGSGTAGSKQPKSLIEKIYDGAGAKRPVVTA